MIDSPAIHKCTSAGAVGENFHAASTAMGVAQLDSKQNMKQVVGVPRILVRRQMRFRSFITISSEWRDSKFSAFLLQIQYGDITIIV